MLYFLIEYLEGIYQPPGFQVVQFISVRAGLAAITALLLSTLVGRRIIRWLKRNQFGEQVRASEDAGGVDHSHKAGTPTMGGLILLLGALGSVFLWGDLTQVYVWLTMLAMAGMGAVGFADDYIKSIKKNKDGVAPMVKVSAQVAIGALVGAVLYFHPQFEDVKGLTYLPFIKTEVINYDFFRFFIEDIDLGWLVYIPIAIFVMTAVSNAVNLTDGLDGLATGTSAFVALGFAGLTYVSGNAVFAGFLSEMFLPGAGELTVFMAALAAACFGFLWYNGYPATVFMGDTGSLALGAVFGAAALMIRKELLLPLLCSVFFVEALSVVLQTLYFKYTKRKYGEGRRIFLIAPLHHHYERKGFEEPKIVTRFWIITAITVIATFIVLRIR
ncbi:MAG: phospho-N-acetylmuramoyl-pentapeptide-transferase [Rhodothermales bacterium]